MVGLGCSMAMILMCMCDGQMLYNGVGVVSKGSGMRLNGKYWNSTRLSNLVLLGCTALMRANSLKHPPGCLQFAEMGKEKGVDGKWKKLGRRGGAWEKTGRGFAFVCVHSE